MPDRTTVTKGRNATHPLHVIPPFHRVPQPQAVIVLKIRRPLRLTAVTKPLAVVLHHHPRHNILHAHFRVVQRPEQLLSRQAAITIRIDIFEGFFVVIRPADTGAAASGVRDGYSGPHAGAAGWPDENEYVRRAAVRPDRPGLGGIRESGRELPDSEGVLNDGVGNAFVDRIEKFAGRAKRAVESLRTGAARFTEHVRAYCSGQRAIKSAGDELAGAGEQLNAAAPALWEPVRAEQAIARHRQEEQQRLIEAQRQRQEQERRLRQRQYHGPSM